MKTSTPNLDTMPQRVPAKIAAPDKLVELAIHLGAIDGGAAAIAVRDFDIAGDQFKDSPIRLVIRPGATEQEILKAFGRMAIWLAAGWEKIRSAPINGDTRDRIMAAIASGELAEVPADQPGQKEQGEPKA